MKIIVKINGNIVTDTDVELSHMNTASHRYTPAPGEMYAGDPYRLPGAPYLYGGEDPNWARAKEQVIEITIKQ